MFACRRPRGEMKPSTPRSSTCQPIRNPPPSFHRSFAYHRGERGIMADGGQISGGGTDERDQFIPVRKADILHALIDDGRLPDGEAEKFRLLCRLLGAIYHYEYFDRLETLRNDYYYFNP